jgi:hypothetical protein
VPGANRTEAENGLTALKCSFLSVGPKFHSLF